MKELTEIRRRARELLHAGVRTMDQIAKALSAEFAATVYCSKATMWVMFTDDEGYPQTRTVVR